MKSQVWILLFGLMLRGAEAAELGYPSEWWAPVPTNEAASWEVLPQAAGPGEVILSKRTELGILSNFAPTPFSLDGEKYASVEGFWQMLKYPEGPGDERLRDPTVVWPHARAEVAAMVGLEAKDAGAAANENMKKLGIRWVTYQGRRMEYRETAKGDFYILIRRAEQAKHDQNPPVVEILKKTGTLMLRPDHLHGPEATPAERYNEIWMDIRAQRP